MSLGEILILMGLGLAAGALGGMLGIGGSIVMIPVLTVLLHHDQHVAQAAVMIIHIVVSIPSMLQHHKAGAVRWDVFRRMLPFGLGLILIGVMVSNIFDSELMKQLFGVFLLYVVAVNVLKMMDRKNAGETMEAQTTWPACGSVGGVMGFMAGLLGIGGGIIAVPLLQRVCRLPLRQCIATSSAVMCLTAVPGSILKNLTLAKHGLSVGESLTVAAALAPTAVLGGMYGARLTHALPLNVVRAAFVLLLLWASLEMLGLISVSRLLSSGT